MSSRDRGHVPGTRPAARHPRPEEEHRGSHQRRAFLESFAQLDIALLSCGVAISDTGSSASLIWALYAAHSGLQLTQAQFSTLLPDLPSIASLPRSDENHSMLQASSMMQRGFASLRKAFVEFGGNNPDMYILGSLDALIAGLEDLQSWVERPNYANDASPQTHIDALVNSLNLFQTTALVRVRNAQRAEINSQQNLSTITALLSTVTATCLQITYQQNAGTLHIVMNAFWMSSLAFSIFCTIWSQLSSRWILSKFHSRGSEWVNIIVGSMPTILLSMACATFGGGLVCLAYTFFPHTAIPPIVIVQIVGLTTAGAVFLIWRFVDGMLLHPYWKHKAAIFGGASSIRMHRRRSRQEYGDPAVSLQRRASADDLEKGENRGLSRSPSSIDVMVQLPATPEVSTPAMGSDTILRIHSVPMKETTGSVAVCSQKTPTPVLEHSDGAASPQPHNPRNRSPPRQPAAGPTNTAANKPITLALSSGSLDTIQTCAAPPQFKVTNLPEELVVNSHSNSKKVVSSVWRNAQLTLATWPLPRGDTANV